MQHLELLKLAGILGFAFPGADEKPPHPNQSSTPLMEVQLPLSGLAGQPSRICASPVYMLCGSNPGVVAQTQKSTPGDVQVTDMHLRNVQGPRISTGFASVHLTHVTPRLTQNLLQHDRYNPLSACFIVRALHQTALH